MISYPQFQNSLKRAFSKEGLIVLCLDILMIPVVYVMYLLFYEGTQVIAGILTRINLSQIELINNSVVSQINLVLLREVGLQLAFYVISISLIFSVFWSLFSVIQWRIIKKIRLNPKEVIIAASGYTAFILMCIILSIILLFFLIDPSLISATIIFLIIFVSHYCFSFSYSTSSFVLPKKFRWSNNVRSLVKAWLKTSHTVVHKSVLGYALIIVLIFLSLIISDISISLNLHPGWFFLFVFLLFLCWWRFFMDELLSARHKKKHSSR